MFGLRSSLINRNYLRLILYRIRSSFRIIIKIIFQNCSLLAMIFFKFQLFWLILSQILHNLSHGWLMQPSHFWVTYNVVWRKFETWKCCISGSGWHRSEFSFKIYFYKKQDKLWNFNPIRHPKVSCLTVARFPI